MKFFIKYLKEENIIGRLIDAYKDNLKNKKDKKFLIFLIEKLYNLEEFEKNIVKSDDINSINFDILGRVYEKNLHHKERKALGEFYTPLTIVNYILHSAGYNHIEAIENKKLIDISCGSGSFIIQAIKLLIERFKTVFKKEAYSEFTVKEAKYMILKIEENISGIDINPIACILCQINIHFVLFEIIKLIRKSDKSYRLPHFNIKNINAITLRNEDKYDYVVGNPPYLFIRDIPNEQKKVIEDGNLLTNDGQYDYYQIFIEIGIKLLKNQGKLGYILPDSILALTNRKIIRKFIYNTTKIKEIYYTGPKFDELVVSNIILILIKESNNKEKEKNTIIIKLADQQEKQIIQEIINKWDFKFLINLNDTDISIIEYLSKNFPNLEDLHKKEDFKINISRGVELTKTGEIIYCERCEKYFPVPKKTLICPKCNFQLKKEYIEKIIHDEIPEDKKEDFESFLYSINRYQIKDNKYIDISKNGINYKDLDIYEDRIIIRQLSQNNLICATYDKELSLTSQSYYNLKIYQSTISEFNNLYLLGILNSQLLSYYFIKSFGSYKKLFPRILIERIKNLPIKLPKSEEEKRTALNIIANVKIRLNYKNKKFFKNIQEKIDSLIFDLYKISEENREYIVNFMKNL